MSYVKLTEAPAWCIQYPTCGACDVDLEIEEDWTCPNCGTSWPGDASDGETGELYESWAGEKLDGPPVTHDEASDIAYRKQAEERSRWLAEFKARTQ